MGNTKYHIFGDLHGCYEALCRGFANLGYSEVGKNLWRPPKGYQAIFVGDLVDRGPQSLACLLTVRNMVKEGFALAVAGNHEDKLVKCLAYALGDTKVKPPLSSSRARTLWELMQKPEIMPEILAFLRELPIYLLLDKGQLVVVHAGWKSDLDELPPLERRKWCLYGPVSDDEDEDAYFPKRIDWTPSYHGDAFVVWGHQNHDVPYFNGRTVNIDQGCCLGGSLTILEYPSLQIYTEPSGYDYRQEMRLLKAMRRVIHYLLLSEAEASEEQIATFIKNVGLIRQYYPQLMTQSIEKLLQSHSDKQKDYQVNLRRLVDESLRLVYLLKKYYNLDENPRHGRKEIVLRYRETPLFSVVMAALDGKLDEQKLLRMKLSSGDLEEMIMQCEQDAKKLMVWELISIISQAIKYSEIA